MELARSFYNQWRKPTGLIGRLLARILNASHIAGANWGLGHIAIKKDMIILDIGCGGGLLVRKLATCAKEGRVFGIDYSKESVRAASKTNAKLIERGRVEIRQGTVSELPYPEAMFDLVTAVNSHYYWPQLRTDMGQALRVLKPAGVFAIIGEAYKGGKFDNRNKRFVELTGLTYQTVEELQQMLKEVGFGKVEVFEQYEKGWICSTARKPG